MTPTEKIYHDALVQIAARDCASICGIIAQKALEKGLRAKVDQVIESNWQVIETYNRTFEK
jgi:hypothetical protein